MKRIATLVALSALLLAPAACGGGAAKPATSGAAGPATKVTLTLNWVPYGEHAPFYYGLKKGFYAAEGIDLQIKPGTGSGPTIQQVAQKNTTFGWADTPVLLKSISTGMKVKSLGVFLQKGPSSIESLADKNINSPADLKGKTIGGTPGDALYATFPAWLKANNLALTDVKVVNVDPAGKIAALSEGRVDAIMGFFHDQGPTIEGKTHKKVNYLLYADYGLNLLGTGIIVNEETLNKDPELARKFVRATQKSWAEAAKDIPGAVDAMAELAENEPPKDVLTKQLTLAIPLLELDKAAAPGVNSNDKWAGTIELMTKYADLKNAGTPATYWDGTYAK
ncbi:MAG: sulfonate ABC transporter substrate-binding protein [Actinobacteria bacterium 13_2_20CM_2_71_6]|nr:MAG: sulfonate ABC transporter substrate-binding protein [Actinobacteria bacterium 13_2_20CM_2_71_6]